MKQLGNLRYYSYVNEMYIYIYNYVTVQNLLIRSLIDIISKLYWINQSDSLPEQKMKRIDEALVEFELTTNRKGLYKQMVDNNIFESEFVNENGSSQVIKKLHHKNMSFELCLN
mgnify:CR=1 FL=1